MLRITSTNSDSSSRPPTPRSYHTSRTSARYLSHCNCLQHNGLQQILNSQRFGGRMLYHVCKWFMFRENLKPTVTPGKQPPNQTLLKRYTCLRAPSWAQYCISHLKICLLADVTENTNNDSRSCSLGPEASFPLWFVAVPLLAELATVQNAPLGSVSRTKPISFPLAMPHWNWFSCPSGVPGQATFLKPGGCFFCTHEDVCASYLARPDLTCWTKQSFCPCTVQRLWNSGGF